MILKIRKYGDKVLRNKSTAVEKIDDEDRSETGLFAISFLQI